MLENFGKRLYDTARILDIINVNVGKILNTHWVQKPVALRSLISKNQIAFTVSKLN